LGCNFVSSATTRLSSSSPVTAMTTSVIFIPAFSSTLGLQPSPQYNLIFFICPSFSQTLSSFSTSVTYVI